MSYGPMDRTTCFVHCKNDHEVVDAQAFYEGQVNAPSLNAKALQAIWMTIYIRW